MKLADSLSHTRYVLINRLAAPVSSFLLLLIIARVSDELLGEYAVVMGYYWIMQMLPLLGLTTYVMREVARRPGQAGKYYVTVGALSLGGCLLVDLLVFLALSLLGYSPDVTQGIHILAILIVPGILVFISEIIFMSLHKARVVGLVAVADNGLRMVLSLAALALDLGLVGLVWAFLLSRLLACACYFLLLLRSGMLAGCRYPDLRLLGDIVRVLPAFLLGTILLSLVQRLDFIVLSLSVQAEYIGYYAIGFRVLDIGLVFLSGLIMAFFPALSRRYTGARSRYLASLRVLVTVFTVGLVLLCFGGILYAEYYVQWLFNRQYPNAVLMAQLFTALLLLAGLDHLFSSLLHAADRQREDTRAMLFSSAAYAGGLFWLVPVAGIQGAYAAKALSTLCQALLRIAVLRRRLGNFLPATEVLKLLVFAGLLAALALSLLEAGFLVKTVAIVAAGPVSLLLLIALGLCRPLRLLRYHWRGRGHGEVDSVSALLDLVVADLRRQSRLRRRGAFSAGRKVRRHAFTRGEFAVTIHRVTRYLYLKGFVHLSHLLVQLGYLASGVKVLPECRIAPGLVLPDKGPVFIAADAGGNLTCGSGVRVGAGRREKALLGDQVTLLDGARVPAGVELPSGTVFDASPVGKQAT